MAGISTTASWRDLRGRVGKVRFNVAAGTPANESTQASAVVTAISNMSEAAFVVSHGAFNTAPTSVIYGASATYSTVEDKAVFTFQTAVGAIHRLQVPAPQSGIFLADGMTVDITATAVAAFITATVGIITDANGNALTTMVGGIRVRRKLQRKINIFSLGPSGGIEE